LRNERFFGEAQPGREELAGRGEDRDAVVLQKSISLFGREVVVEKKGDRGKRDMAGQDLDFDIEGGRSTESQALQMSFRLDGEGKLRQLILSSCVRS
jgi:hypothetical protein